MDKFDSLVWAVVGGSLSVLLLAGAYALVAGTLEDQKRNAVFIEMAKLPAQ